MGTRSALVWIRAGAWIAAALSASAGFGATLTKTAPPGFTLKDTAGSTHTDAEWKGREVVLFFITTDCPISNSYVPEMNRIAKAYTARGVKFYAVMTDTSIPVPDVVQYAKDYQYSFPVLLDPSQLLVKYTHADTNPESVVVTPNRGVAYMGRIDNRVAGFGLSRQQVTEHELKDVIDETLAAKPVAKAFATPIGCSIVRVN